MTDAIDSLVSQIRKLRKRQDDTKEAIDALIAHAVTLKREAGMTQFEARRSLKIALRGEEQAL